MNCAWAESRWGDISRLEYGKALRDYRSDVGAYRVFGTNGPIGWYDEPLCKHPGIVIGRKGAYRGIHYSPEPFFVIDTAFYLEPKQQMDLRWAYYCLLTYDINSMDSGSAIPSTSRESFEGLPVRVPPLPEQKAIAHILGTLDDKIEVNRRMNETLEGMARALFKSWFVDFDPVLDNALAAGNPIPEEYRDRAAQRADAATSAASQGRPFGLPNPLAAQFPNAFHDSDLGPIPQGWEVRNLGELCAKPQYGYTASAKDEPIGPRFLRIKDINKSPWIEWASVPYCEISDKDLEKYTVYRGDLLIARMADPGHGVLVEGERDAVFASYLIRFRPQNPEHQHYLQLWLKSDGYWQLINSRKTGTTRASLNAQVLSRLPLVVPSSDTCTIFSSIVSRFRKRGNANVEHSESLAALRDTLLPKLLSGELRVNDAEKFVEAAV